MKKNYNLLYDAAFQITPLNDQQIEGIKELYIAEGKEKIENEIRKRKFVPFVANALVIAGFQEDGWDKLRDSYSARNQKVIQGLNVLYRSFDKYAVDRVVVVENFGAFLSANAEPLWRFGSGDVDLYGDIAQKEKIYQAAADVGFSFEERYAGNNLISTSFTHQELLPENFYFDIGWYPTVRLKIPFLDYKEEIVDWGNCRFFKDSRIRLPDKEALLYICMMHISVHNFSRQPDIRLYIDIQNAIFGGDIDWNRLIKWAKRDKFTNRVSTVGYLSKKLLDCNIPDEIINLSSCKGHLKLIKFVYDEENNLLLAKPGTLASIRIEMMANDVSEFRGLIELVFPKKNWLRKTYGGSTLKAYFSYIWGLFK